MVQQLSDVLILIDLSHFEQSMKINTHANRDAIVTNPNRAHMEGYIMLSRTRRDSDQRLLLDDEGIKWATTISTPDIDVFSNMPFRGW